MNLYVAGPLGFSETGRLFYYKKLLPMLIQLGCSILYPWDLTPQSAIDAVANLPYGPKRKEAWQRLNKEIASNNTLALASADLVFAVLDGVDVDSGTAAEIGYAFGLAKRIVGYRGDFRLAGDNEGAVVNLQVEYFIRASGGDIVTSFDDISPLIGKHLPLRSAMP